VELGLLYTESKMLEQVEECLEVGVIQGGVGTPVHGVQDVGAGGRVAGWGEVTRVCPDL
jgi:hypothetical protein